MYPKKSCNLSSGDKKETDKMNRRSQLKDLIINKFKSKYATGGGDIEERVRIITDEVSHFILNEK